MLIGACNSTAVSSFSSLFFSVLQVKFFRFPALAKHSAPVAKQVGHSAHVTNVKFSYDDGQVITHPSAASHHPATNHHQPPTNHHPTNQPHQPTIGTKYPH